MPANPLSHRHYAAFFSLGYAMFNVFSFYPGILYSDSSPRWRLAMDLANHGLSILSVHSNQFPVLPSFLMSAFYTMTNEIGFYILCQSFAFALSLFVFVYSFQQGVITNLLVSIALLTPINRVYSLFHSYDSVAAIALILLAASIVRLLQGDDRQRYYLPILFLTLAAFRLNAPALLIPTAMAVAVLVRRRGLSRKATALYLIGLSTLTVAPLVVNAALPMIPYNTWALGVSWEYLNLAVTAGQEQDLEYLANNDVEIERLSMDGCYRSIYCDKQVLAFASGVAKDSHLSRVVLRKYIALAVDHPGQFLKEKSKYSADLLGLRGPIADVEIGKWRQSSGEWLSRFAALGFYPSDAKERFIDTYFSFVKTFDVLLLRPYLAFAAGSLLVTGLLATRRRELAFSIVPPLSLAVGYYATFIVTNSSHELRYYFPSLFVMQGIGLVALAIALTNLWSAIGPKNAVHERDRMAEQAVRVGE